jgi:hypothetical protein
MQYRTATNRLEHVIAGVESLHLEPIKFNIGCKEDVYGWTGEHAERIELAYRRFLVLRAKFPQQQIAPTRDIDAFWHAHILDTRKYAADCDRIFGEFVHHYPYLGLLGDQGKLDEAAATLRQLFVSEFGEEVPNNARGATGAAWCGVDPAGDKAVAWWGVEPAGDKAAAWCGIEVKGLALPVPVMRPEHVRISAEGKRTH